MFHFLKTLLLICGCFPAAATVSHKDCPNKNLTSEYGEVRSSDRWCWAKATADLIGAAQGLKPPRRVSELDVGLSLFTTSKSQLNKTIDRLLLTRPDLADWLNSIRPLLEVELDNANGQLELDPLYDLGSSPLLAIAAYESKQGYCVDDQLKLEKEQKKNADVMKDYMDSVAKRYGHGLPVALDDGCPRKIQAIEALESSNLELNRSLVSELQKQIDQNCVTKEKFKPMVPIMAEFPDNGGKPSELLALWLKKDVPVAIGFYTDFLENGGSPTGAEDHAAVVAGSHWNPLTRSCDFVIRDSLGPDCKQYALKYQQRCNKGYITLTENEINSSTSQIFALATQSSGK